MLTNKKAVIHYPTIFHPYYIISVNFHFFVDVGSYQGHTMFKYVHPGDHILCAIKGFSTNSQALTPHPQWKQYTVSDTPL